MPWLKLLNEDDRPMLSSIITFTTPSHMLKDLDIDWFKANFHKVLVFRIPDDYGEFPDTSGYERKDFEKLESNLEDPNLYKYMQRALDAVVEFNDKRLIRFEKRGYEDLEGFIHAPKFGSRIFCTIGIVRGRQSGMIISPNQYKMSGVLN